MNISVVALAVIRSPVSPLGSALASTAALGLFGAILALLSSILNMFDEVGRPVPSKCPQVHSLRKRRASQNSSLDPIIWRLGCCAQPRPIRAGG